MFVLEIVVLEMSILEMVVLEIVQVPNAGVIHVCVIMWSRLLSCECYPRVVRCYHLGLCEVRCYSRECYHVGARVITRFLS